MEENINSSIMAGYGNRCLWNSVNTIEWKKVYRFAKNAVFNSLINEI